MKQCICQNQIGILEETRLEMLFSILWFVLQMRAQLHQKQVAVVVPAAASQEAVSQGGGSGGGGGGAW